MRCKRCDGFMLVDSFYDMLDSGGEFWLRAWRCVNCGQVDEPLIARNRLLRRSRLERVARRILRKPSPVRDIVHLSA